jgi:RNA polymerase sigma-70 factor, ECF subfamily
MTKPKRGDQAVRDPEQFEEMFRAHYRAVLAYGRRRATEDGVDDIVAETFLVAWRRLEHIPPDALPWLLGVARNVIATRRRGAIRRGALHSRLRHAAVDTFALPVLPDSGSVEAALISLSEKDREALKLTAWEGLSPSQAAAVLGESPGAFRVRLHRARQRLRRALEQPGGQAQSPGSVPLATKESSP